jgi:hypothetical protein
MIEDSKEQLLTLCRDLVENLRSTSEVREFCENDFIRAIQEHFSKVLGSITIDEGGLLAKHNDSNSTFAYILGEELYSQSRQTIRFKIEQSQTPYHIFFDCVASQINFHKRRYKSSFLVGWLGSNEVHQHGTFVQKEK